MESTLNALEVATVVAQKEELSEEWRVRLLTAASGLVTALQKPVETLMNEALWVRGGQEGSKSLRLAVLIRT